MKILSSFIIRVSSGYSQNSVVQAYDLVMGAILTRLLRLGRRWKGRPDMDFIVDNLAIGGSNPLSLLASSGIKAVVDLRAETASEETKARKLSLDYLKVGVPDGCFPTPDQARLIIKWIDSMLREGKTIMIQCNLGRGRAPLVAGLYLMSRGKSFEGAIRMIKTRRFIAHINWEQFMGLAGFSKG